MLKLTRYLTRQETCVNNVQNGRSNIRRKRGATTSFREPHSLAFNTGFSKSGRTISRKAESKHEQETCLEGSGIERVEGLRLATLSTKK